MKKRILSMVLVLCLIVGFCPSLAFADEDDFIIENGILSKYNGPGGDVIIPDGVTRIGKNAFSRCQNLISVQIPEGVTSIGEYAFFECRSLLNATMPSSLERIEMLAFDHCTSLKEINFPENLTWIGGGAFACCRKLMRVELPKNLSTIPRELFYGCDILETVLLPEHLSSIDSGAFSWCSSLVEVSIPFGINHIHKDAFSNGGLRTVFFDGSPDSLTVAGMSPIDYPDVGFVFEDDPTYTIFFDSNGGNQIDKVMSVRQNALYGTLPKATNKEGNVFVGWYTAKEGGNRIISSTRVDLTSDQTLYAHWTPIGSPLISAKKGAKPDKLFGSPNVHKQHYGNWASPVSSYLYEDKEGSLVRVQFGCQIKYGEQKVLIEKYSNDYSLQSYLYIQPELPIWGGFFSGEQYNFLIYGSENLERSDDAEVVRVVRYDKKWNRIDHVSLRSSDGLDVAIPFKGGSVRCVESCGYLFIHTCREMYDGHQANMTFSIDQDAMKVIDAGRPAYVSHSFNQFILVNQDGKLLTVDHGDAYPRAFMLAQYDLGLVEKGLLGSSTETYLFQQFPGSIGENATGANLGGFIETEDGYLVAYACNPLSQNSLKRDIFLHFIDKDGLTGKSVQLTETNDASTPILVPMSLDKGYIMWNTRVTEDIGDKYPFTYIGNTLCYAEYTASGKVGIIKQATGELSDCAPIYYNGKLTWYTTTDDQNAMLTFYALDADGNLSHKDIITTNTVAGNFSDVHSGDYFANAVLWAVERGITSGTGNNMFSPKASCTRGQIVTFLWRAAGNPEPKTVVNPFTDVKSTDYYFKAVLWAVENNITSGIGNGKFGPGNPCTRGQAVTFLWRAAGNPDVAGPGNSFRDVKNGSYYEKAVNWAVVNSITSGTNSTDFSPDESCTRGQIVTFLYRANS